ncbi:MAG: hypothetical protein IJU42_07455 [Erysipelotrichaceae bacterium]|nr:hypothetical protein [Erysipelotrichaceae bacterium]
MVKTLILIRDIIMYIGMLVGLFLIGYVRVSFSSRQKKTSVPLDYDEREKKLRKTAIIILVITVALALIPTRYL